MEDEESSQNCSDSEDSSSQSSEDIESDLERLEEHFFFPALPDKCETWSVNYWNEPVIEIKFPQKKETNNQPNKSNKTSNTHTQAKARARQISQGNLQTKWNQVKHTRPSQPLICSRPPCSTPPRCPIIKCQPYQYLPLDTQASL